jgi:hypothetical protein
VFHSSESLVSYRSTPESIVVAKSRQVSPAQ